MPINASFSLVNAVYSLALVVILGGIIWYKMHLLRMEIHALVEKLPQIGSEFIRQELDELKDELDRTRARVAVCEERHGLDGGETKDG